MNRAKFLKAHPMIDYWLRAIKYSRDREYVQISRSIFRDPNLLYFKAYGSDHPDKLFYDLYIDAPSKGFFALLNQTLDGLKYAERYHLVPVVTWSSKCLYKENGAVNGSHNPFNYFFEEINEFSRKDLTTAKNVLKYNYGQRALDKDHQFGVVAKTIIENNMYDEYIAESAEIYRKYIRIRKSILDTIDDVKAQIGFGDSVLGVHVRATDFSKGYINHAVMVTANEYIENVRAALSEQDFDKIYLATDDAKVVKEFEKEFPGMVIYDPGSFRSTDGNAVHFSSSERKNHKYLLGVEVITDMYLLSECAGLIGGYSNVCIAAQIAKSSTGGTYRFKKIIDKGFNTTGITTLQDHKK